MLTYLNIARRIKARTTLGWTEVALSNCNHGCKWYARKRGIVVEFVISHNATYGCTDSYTGRKFVNPA